MNESSINCPHQIKNVRDINAGEIPHNDYSIKRDEISWMYLIVYLFSIVFIICSFVFMNVGQSFLIREIDPNADVSSNALSLVFYDEVLAIILIGVWGHVSDRFGRKLIYATGFFLIMFSMLLCSLAATTIFPTSFLSFFNSLLAFRLLFSVGCSMVASLMTAFLSDIAPQKSTGRLAGFVGIASCIGGLIGAILFPLFPTRIGYFALGAFLGFLSILILYFFVDRPPSTVTFSSSRLGIKEIIIVTFKATKNDKNIFLSYLNSIVSRSVSMINTALLEVWVSSYLSQSPGPSSAKPIVIRLNGVLQGTSLLMAPVFGIISSRISPAVATLIAALLGSMGDLLMVFFATNPTSSSQIGVMFLKGAGQIGLIVSGMALASRHAPTELRGAVSGAYGFFGAFGIILNSQLAKWTGKYSSSNPFLLLLSWELLLAIFAFMIIFFYGKKEPPSMKKCNIEI